jgi:hypothetical protein
MTPEEILSAAEDMARHHPGHRLRLTGAEVLATVEHAVAEMKTTCAEMEAGYRHAHEQRERALSESDRLRLACKPLRFACEQALATLRVAIRVNTTELEGFSAEDHVTIKLLRETLEKAAEVKP